MLLNLSWRTIRHFRNTKENNKQKEKTMNAGQQVMLVVINNGVVVQHPPPVSLIDAEGNPQQTQNLAIHKGSFADLVAYLKTLDLFQDEV